MMGWISVKDELPPRGERVMVWYKTWIEPDVKFLSGGFYVAHDGGMDSCELKREHVHFWHKWPKAPLWFKEEKPNINQQLKHKTIKAAQRAEETRHIHQQTKAKITCCFCGSKCVRIRGESDWVKCSKCGELHRK